MILKGPTRYATTMYISYKSNISTYVFCKPMGISSTIIEIHGSKLGIKVHTRAKNQHHVTQKMDSTTLRCGTKQSDAAKLICFYHHALKKKMDVNSYIGTIFCNISILFYVVLRSIQQKWSLF